MNDIWSIIGLSSLVASVVTVLVGIVKDIVVEKYRFKRQSVAGYIQSQIQIYSRIYFLLKTLTEPTLTELFGTTPENVKELNDIIKAQSSLLEQKALNEWFAIWGWTKKYREGKEEAQKDEAIEKSYNHIRKLLSIIKGIMNSNLIPKYRKIVGETVPDLE